jgi:translocation and assembly module TamB
MKRILLRIGIGAAALAGLIVLAGAALYGVGQSDSGRAWIAARIATFASTPGEREVTIGHIGGNLFRRIRLRDVTVRDSSNPWLVIRSAEIHWNPARLLRGTLHLQELHLSGVRIDRLPVSTADEGSPFAGLQSIRRLPSITVNALTVDDLDLGAPVLGAAAVLQIKGALKSGPDDTVSGNLSVQRSDGPLGSARLTAAYRAVDGHLGIDLDMAEAAGGLVARALNVPGLPPLQGKLKGEGPLSAWRARSTIAFDGLASASAEIALQSGDGVKFQLTGDASVRSPPSAAPAPLWAGSHRYNVSGRYDAAGVVEIDAAEWQAESLQLNLDGRLNVDDLTVDARGTVRSRDGRRLPAGSPHVGAENVTIQATVARSLLQPEVAVKFEIGRLSVPDAVFTGLTGDMTFHPTRTRDGQVSAGAVAGSGSIAGVDISAGHGLREIAGRPVEWKGDGIVDLEKSTIRLRSISVVNGIVDFSGTGSYSMANGKGTATVTVSVADLLPIGTAYGQPIAGSAKLSLAGAIAEFGESIDIELSGGVSGIDPIPPIVEKLMARDIRLGGFASIKSNVVVLRDVSAASGAVSVHLDGRIPVDGKAIDATYRLNVRGSASPIPVGGAEFWCGCYVTGKIAGPLADPDMTGDVSVKALAIKGERFDAVKSRFDMRRLATGPEGKIRADAQSKFGPIALHTDALMIKDVLRLSAIRFDGAGATLEGTVSVPVGGAPMTGEIRFKAEKLQTLLKIAGVAGDGQGSGRVELSAGNGRQRATATLDIVDIRIAADAAGERMRAKRLAVKAASEDLFAAEQLSLTIDISKATAGDVSFDTISLQAKGSPARAEIGVKAVGRWIDPLVVDASFVFNGKGDRYDIQAAKLSGETLGRKFSIGRPFRLQWDKARLILKDFAFAFGDAQATASATLTGASVEGAIALTEWPLATLDRLWSSGLAGTMSGTATLQGTRAKPRGTLMLEIPKIRLASEPETAAFGLAVNGDWQSGRLLLKGRLSKSETPPATLDADLPLRLAADQWRVVLPQNEPISATAKWKGDVATLWKFVPFAWHQVAGAGRVEAKLNGTFARPKLEGRLAIENGTYESLQLGTLLKPLNLAMEFDGTKARLTQFSARDGNSGKVTASGSVTLDPALRYPFEFDLTLDKFRVARRDDLAAAASGKIVAKGVLDDAKVTGRLKTETVELRVLDQLPAEVVDLKVIDKESQEDRTGPKEKRPEPRFDPAFNIVVDLPGRVFVRGRGIDSEWKGNLALSGTLQDPRFSGTMEVVRGQMSVIGKVFRVKRGTVVLPKSDFAEPEILLTATHEGKRLIAEAQAAGPITKPKITLTSSPDLPQDEIVSQILFNKSSSRLSGVEAAQLALALAQLSGAGGSGAGIMDFARKALGVDVLRIESATTANGDQPSVGAGKYLSEDVYLGVKQGATPESGSVGVQVEVTPNITVESEMRRSGASDVGVKFKLDY